MWPSFWHCPHSKVKYMDIAVCSLTCHTATWTHMPYRITPAIRQRWHSRLYPSGSWYSVKRPRRDARLSWPSWLVNSVVCGTGSLLWSSVCPSVCPIIRPQLEHAVVILLSAMWAGDIDRQCWHQVPSSTGPQHVAPQQIQAVPCWQPSWRGWINIDLMMLPWHYCLSISMSIWPVKDIYARPTVHFKTAHMPAHHYTELLCTVQHRTVLTIFSFTFQTVIAARPVLIFACNLYRCLYWHCWLGIRIRNSKNHLKGNNTPVASPEFCCRGGGHGRMAHGFQSLWWQSHPEVKAIFQK